MYGPNPWTIHPMEGFPQVTFIKNTVNNPNIIIGDYTYYDDNEGSEDFQKNVLYHYPFMQDKLIIGKFCAIAKNAQFVMNGANHKLNCFTTYPFSIFKNGWEKVIPEMSDLPYKGDTVIGNDVWIGYDAIIMPGIKIGNGAIIAARSVVVNNVDAYTIYGGNPAKLIRERFSKEVIELLEKIKWWDWPIEKITKNLEILTSNAVNELRKFLSE